MDTLNNNLFDAIFAPKHENKGTSSLKSTFKDSYFSLLDKKEEDASYQVIETSLSKAVNKERFRYRMRLKLDNL